MRVTLAIVGALIAVSASVDSVAQSYRYAPQPPSTATYPQGTGSYGYDQSQQYGNTTSGRSGQTLQQFGTTTYGSSGQTYQQYGNTIYGPNNETWQQYGSRAYGPNNRVCQTYGDRTYCQ